MLKKIAALSLVVFLFGCGTPTIKKDYAINNASPTGIIIYTLSYEGPENPGQYMIVPKIGSLSMHFRNKSTNKHEWNSLGDQPAGFNQYDFEKESTRYKGKLFVVELPVGEYEFFRWLMSRGTGLLESKGFKPIPFSVEQARVKYIGELHFDLIAADNMFGLPLIFGAKLSVIDNHKRDLELALKNYPNLHLNDATIALLPDYQTESNGNVVSGSIPQTIVHPAKTKH